jgi:hypothetical protein
MDPVLIPILGMLIPLVIVPVALVTKHARTARQLEHAERMRALELGRTLPMDESWWSPPRICVAIGAGVPIGVFLAAWLASASVGYQDGIWVGAMGVGLAGVIGGSILSARYLAQRERSQASYAKPVVDDDAYDVVGARG